MQNLDVIRFPFDLDGYYLVAIIIVSDNFGNFLVHNKAHSSPSGGVIARVIHRVLTGNEEAIASPMYFTDAQYLDVQSINSPNVRFSCIQNIHFPCSNLVWFCAA